MNLVITISEVLTRCKTISAFDARRATTTSGESLYDEVRITDADEAVVKEYINQAAHIIEGQMSSVLDVEGLYESTQITWTIHEDASRRQTGINRAFLNTAQEAMAMYALYRWMENKLPETSKSYDNVFTTLLDAAMKIIKTKAKPSRPTA